MSTKEARDFLERELAKSESTTQFYWENDETQEAVDLLIEAFARLIAANNMKADRDRQVEAEQTRFSA